MPGGEAASRPQMPDRPLGSAWPWAVSQRPRTASPSPPLWAQECAPPSFRQAGEVTSPGNTESIRHLICSNVTESVRRRNEQQLTGLLGLREGLGGWSLACKKWGTTRPLCLGAPRALLGISKCWYYLNYYCCLVSDDRLRLRFLDSWAEAVLTNSLFFSPVSFL